MSKITSPRSAERARERIEQIRQELGAIELLCSGTLLKRMKTCGSATCRCAHDPSRAPRTVLRVGPHARRQARPPSRLGRTGRSVASSDRQLPKAQEAPTRLGKPKRSDSSMQRDRQRRDLAARSRANPVRSCSKCPGDRAKSPRAGASFLRRKVANVLISIFGGQVMELTDM